MRYSWLAGLTGLLLSLGTAAPASAQISVSIGAPSLDIGIQFPTLPNLMLIPGSPVYYAPGVDANFFFYDGLYWVYANDNWYSSSWYNGPWSLVAPDIVPTFILQVPVRYYRRPPSYFHGWAANAPPRWGEHWGHAWEEKHSGWDRVARGHVAPAPLPSYQRQYSGKRYPGVEQQQVLHSRNYRYQPREPVVREHYAQHAAPQQHGQAQRPEPKGDEHKR